MSRNATFLPEDYLAKKAELRTNVICLLLFAAVMFGVFVAFMVTNRRWSSVKDEQARINAEYREAADQIKLLAELEEQKTEMLHKAELAAALVERVPRSVLLAEIINRMPDGLSLLEFTLGSDKVKPALKRDDAKGSKGAKPIGPKRASTKSEAAAKAEDRKVEAPRFRTDVSLVGVAPTDLEVSRFIAELSTHPLLRDVALVYSEEQDIEGETMRKFQIDLRLDPEADVRGIDPLEVPRLKSAMLRNPGNQPQPARYAGEDGGE